MNAAIGSSIPPKVHGVTLARSRRLRASNSAPRGSSGSAGGPVSPASALRITLVMATK